MLRILIPSVILLSSCANQVAPSGGEKDLIPPKMVSANPPLLSTHVTDGIIKITFDEYVQLNNPASEIYFSPALNRNPSYRLRGKSLFITLNDTLQTNTTYSIHFGNAIKDIHEGNAMKGFTYVFSTGTYIDSFRISGLVKNIVDGKPVSGAAVMLYRNWNDSLPLRSKPYYSTFTDEPGNFEIAHIKEGLYKLIGLDDANQNLLYDENSEAIAFQDSLIAISDTAGIYQLTLFKPVPAQQRILSSQSLLPGRIAIRFAKPAEKLSLQVKPESDYEIIYSNKRDSAQIWVADLQTDSIILLLADGAWLDTVAVKMKKPDPKKDNTPKFSLLSNLPGEGNEWDPGNNIAFQFRTPLKHFQPEKWKLTSDSFHHTISFAAVRITDSITLQKSITITALLEENKRYEFSIPDSTIFDLYGNSNDSVNFIFLTGTREETGNLELILSVPDSVLPAFIQLADQSKKAVSIKKIMPGENRFYYPGMRAGEYLLELIADENENLKWDTGSYWKKIQPEKIFRYEKQILLRPGWDLEIEFNLNRSSGKLKEGG